MPGSSAHDAKIQRVVYNEDIHITRAMLADEEHTQYFTATINDPVKPEVLAHVLEYIPKHALLDGVEEVPGAFWHFHFQATQV